MYINENKKTFKICGVWNKKYSDSFYFCRILDDAVEETVSMFWIILEYQLAYTAEQSQRRR